MTPWRAADHCMEGAFCAMIICSCLLYTSDAADERSSVDFGGRRNIKKKTQQQLEVPAILH